MTRDSQKARTRRDLVEAARRLLAAGRTPTVADVADTAEVSRRTAYRYFPGAEQLIAEALLEGMRSDVEHEINDGPPDEDITTRVHRLVNAMHKLTLDKENLLRQMIRLTVDRIPSDIGEPLRPSRRIEYVDMALAPLQAELTAADYDRLVHALAIVVGIESRIVLRDIAALDDEEILSTQQWAAQALLAAALAHTRRRKRPKGG